MDDPKADDLYRIGSVATVLQLLKLPDGTVKVLVEGVDRARIEKLHDRRVLSPPMRRSQPDADSYDEREIGRARALGRLAVRAVREAQQEDAARSADRARRHRATPAAWPTPSPRTCRSSSREKQKVLEILDVAQAPRAHPGRHRGRDGHAADREAHPRPRQGADGEEPARVLPERADEGDPEGARREDEDGNEIDELEQKIAKAGMPKEAREKATAELNKLKHDVADVGRGDRRAQLHRLAGQRAVEEAHARSARTSQRGQKVLDDDHYGLEKVKERIVEYLAVQQRVDKLQGADPVPGRPAGRGQDLARPDRSRARPTASSCACRSAACATRPRSAATAAPTSARCPARSCRT